MIRAALVSLALMAAPAGAEVLFGNEVCRAVWAKIGDSLGEGLPVRGAISAMDGDWCVVENPVLDLAGDYALDWHADTLRFRGTALDLLLDGTITPDRLEVEVRNLRIVVQTGNPQMDWLFAAQARANTIDADLALGWDAAERVLRLEALNIDFPGANRIEAQALIRNVDLSSEGAMQMSLASFALSEADLTVRTHGLFEWYVLMPLGPRYLPLEGDMDAAVAGIKAELTATIADLPETTVSPGSKAALRALIAELPNPAGDLTVSLRSEAGIGPARFAGYAVTGVPGTVAEAALVLDGVTVDVGWVHTDAD
jgi:hypothetical protein